jgi:hypothetical protein
VIEREWPETAEELMRSRFASIPSADTEWLLDSWHLMVVGITSAPIRRRGSEPPARAFGSGNPRVVTCGSSGQAQVTTRGPK